MMHNPLAFLMHKHFVESRKFGDVEGLLNFQAGDVDNRFSVLFAFGSVVLLEISVQVSFLFHR